VTAHVIRNWSPPSVVRSNGRDWKTRSRQNHWRSWLHSTCSFVTAVVRDLLTTEWLAPGAEARSLRAGTVRAMLANSSTRGAPAGTCSGRSFGAKHATRVVRGFNVPTSRAQKTFQSHDASFHVLCAKQPSRGGKPGAGGDSGGKRNATSGGNPQQTTSAPRITGKVGSMSVHTQIKLVERYKRLSGGSTHSSPGSRSTGPGGGKAGTAVVRRASVEKNTFRKTKDDAYQEELARRRRAAQAEVRHQNTLESFGGIGAAPVLLVDGYNVCACDEGETFSDMKQAFMAGDLETAQRLLINDLETLAAHKGYRVICVFDADRTARASNGLDQVRPWAFPKSWHTVLPLTLVTVQTEAGDCCPYIVQYTPNTGLTLCFTYRRRRKRRAGCGWFFR
jgi:hypothetical protein